MMKDWSGRAKERSKNESTDSKFVWRVQANPKNGMQLKRLPQGKK